MNELPEGYREIRRVNLEKDIKVFISLNVFAFVILGFMLSLGVRFNGIKFIVDKTFILLFVLTFILYVLYAVIHEAVHGIFIKRFSKNKPFYGFTGFCAYAGSNAFFNKKQYIIIALSPIIILGIIIAIINFMIPQSYFWVVYFIQIGNVTGGVGDIYITYLMSRMPQDILIQDTGISMVIYSK